MSIALALKVANSNTCYTKWPLGCVITKGGAVQSVGWSALKSDPRFERCSVHAEEHALRQMKWQAAGCVLYVARVTRTGAIGLAKPCDYCQGLIEASGVKRVVYTTDEGDTGIWKP